MKMHMFLRVTIFTVNFIKSRYQKYISYVEKLFGALLISLGIKIILVRE